MASLRHQDIDSYSTYASLMEGSIDLGGGYVK
jgi:hypothetical protein